MSVVLRVFCCLQALKNNGSLYAHVFFARSGFPIDPNDPEYQPLNCFGRIHRKTERSFFFNRS